MDMTLFIAIITSGAFAAIVTGIFELLRFRRERKAKKEDTAALNIEQRLKAIETQTNVQSDALKYVLYYRINRLGQKYISNGNVSFEERRILNSMHDVYHNGLKGNGDLDILMNEVNSLPLKKGE